MILNGNPFYCIHQVEVMKAALILAGGNAKRFHRKRKAFITLKGKPLLQWVIECVAPCVDTIFLSGNEDLASFGYTVVQDVQSGLGPLAGFHAGISAIGTEYTFVAGCDMPFIEPALVHHLFKRASGYSCCLPRKDEFIEPLCCVYNTEDVKKCIHTVVTNGKRRIWDLIQCLPNPQYISFEEVKTIDPDLLSFRNVNTPEDLKAAEDIIRKREGLL
jgi:molybdopterin-guanine dinucleotide biosynthesis protein A